MGEEACGGDKPIWEMMGCVGDKKNQKREKGADIYTKKKGVR